MTEEIKKLIEAAPVKRSGVFQSFLMIPSGEKYDGFWGENGYNNIILLGMSEEGWCNITECADSVMYSRIKHVNFDIPSEYNCVRFWFDEPIKIRNELNLSTVMGYPSEEDETKNYWIVDRTPEEDWNITCNQCETVFHNPERLWNYCPECGQLMDGRYKYKENKDGEIH